MKSGDKLKDPGLIYGCMGLGGTWDSNPPTGADVQQARQAVDAALEAGITWFDHADIYKFGKAETIFGHILQERPSLRESLVIQSKCGIVLGPQGTRYNLGRDYVLAAVDASLERLKTDHLDILLFHRPDPLMEPEELARAVEALHSSGKVLRFGVSNMSRSQIEFLQAYLPRPLEVMQSAMSLEKRDWLEPSVTVNHWAPRPDAHMEGTLEYARLKGLQIQAWGSLDQGLFTGRSLEGREERMHRSAALVAELSAAYQVSPEGLVLAWLRRHPAGIVPVLGSTHPGRIRACADALKINLDREDWYRLWVSIRGEELP